MFRKLQRTSLLCSSWDTARPMNARSKFLWEGNLVLGQSSSFMGTLLLFCRPWSSNWCSLSYSSSVALCAFCPRAPLEGHEEGGKGQLALSWEIWILLVSRPSTGGESRMYPDLAQLMLTSVSPRGAAASSCHCWWWWGHAGYQPGSSEDCLESIKALMKCGCLDGRQLWESWGSGDQALISNSTTQWLLSVHRVWDMKIPFPGG